LPQFTYSIVGFHGTGPVSYREALAAVFMEGYVIPSSPEMRSGCLNLQDRWIFFFLSLLGLRQWLIRLMPQSLILAVGAGIGLFIA
jgi:adenine/guanine/hypoxanthine permease